MEQRRKKEEEGKKEVVDSTERGQCETNNSMLHTEPWLSTILKFYTFTTEGSKRRIESCVRSPQKPSKQPINTSKQPINLTAEGPNRVSEGKAPPDKGIERGPRHAVNAHQLSRCSTVAIEHCHRDPHHGYDDHQQPRHRHARQCQRPADDKNVLLTKR